MSNLTVPPPLSELLRAADRPTELRDEAGRTIGLFLPGTAAGWEPLSPDVSAAGYEELRQSNTGVPTADLLARLGNR